VEVIDMLESAESKKKTNVNVPEGLFFRRPNVNLLDDKQWLYVQRCYRLSPRELQVARHICRGFGNEEVAREMQISSGTVKTHLRNIYRRIHVTSKIGMLLTFVEQVVALNDKKRTCGKMAPIKKKPETNNDNNPPQINTDSNQEGTQF
jgi:DNA-binding NarL/FixJ family response regulator